MRWRVCQAYMQPHTESNRRTSIQPLHRQEFAAKFAAEALLRPIENPARGILPPQINRTLYPIRSFALVHSQCFRTFRNIRTAIALGKAVTLVVVPVSPRCIAPVPRISPGILQADVLRDMHCSRWELLADQAP